MLMWRSMILSRIRCFTSEMLVFRGYTDGADCRARLRWLHKKESGLYILNRGVGFTRNLT